MEPREKAKSGGDGPNITKSSGTGETPRRHETDPATADLNKARRVWEAETNRDPSGRVADAGDAGGGALPYDEEAEADIVGRQTAARKPLSKDDKAE
ncbi:hypothetical protein [Rhizobium sp. LCM 4573]|uniref:hypothetical protein n=1 Tax=Rhizobium sp. LCM 4573 TaxID=1848291 RepID=UPI0008DAE5A7|nr:hypothetical protein [Rhizobium sp. LCM 4573]OHV84882.1 hypothetical protein LCM4573_04315 [Rhizobium sp. LCM 4573]